MYLRIEAGMKELVMKAYTYAGDLVAEEFGPADSEEWWQKTTLAPGEKVRFGAGFPSRNELYSVDYFFRGGNKRRKLLGIVRIYLCRDRWPSIDEVGGNKKIRIKTDKKVVEPSEEGRYLYKLNFSSNKEVNLTRMDIYYGLPEGGYRLERTYAVDDIEQFLGQLGLGLIGAQQ